MTSIEIWVKIYISAKVYFDGSDKKKSNLDGVKGSKSLDFKRYDKCVGVDTVEGERLYSKVQCNKHAGSLELIRGKRLVFVGDSINRNQWESILRLLMSAVKDPRRVYENETHGRRITKDGKLLFQVSDQDYKSTIEY